MALIAIHRRRYSGHLSGALPRPYKSHPEDPRSTPHLSTLVCSPLPRRNASPPNFSDRHHAAVMPGRHTSARALVSHPPHSPCPTPPLPPLGRRSWTPEWPEAEAPVSSVPLSTAGPPWTGVSVVHGLMDSVHGFPLGKQFPENPISGILHLGPIVFPKSTRSTRIYSQTREFEK
jgi:hypothetical protein